jgi:hypothetical protein
MRESSLSKNAFGVKIKRTNKARGRSGGNRIMSQKHIYRIELDEVTESLDDIIEALTRWVPRTNGARPEEYLLRAKNLITSARDEIVLAKRLDPLL